MLLLDELGVEHPVVQAGMGGGVANAALAGAVSAAGGLGTIGILPPRAFEAELLAAREQAAGRTVAANLLTPFATREHVHACRTAAVRLVVLHAGFERELVQQLHDAGTLVLHTVGTATEAGRALAEGADGLVVQGLEAGGHLVGVEPALSALEHVLPVARSTPVLLAGGIADAADVQRALAAGAQAVVAGTRFLLTPESGAHPLYREAVLGATRTIETQLFGLGWPLRHRVVPNAATERWCRGGALVPRWIGALQRLSTPLQRLPMSWVTGTIRLQRPQIPIFGPTPPLAHMSSSLVEATPLYAGETALRIDSIIPAAEAVRQLAPSAAVRRSPTIRSS